MSTFYAQRSSAVRAAKKAAGPDQEWVIFNVGVGQFGFELLDVNEKQPAAPVLTKAELAKVAYMEDAFADEPAPVVTVESLDKSDAALASMKARLDAMPIAKSTALKPFQLAKQIVSACVSKGITSRKEIIAACIAQGIKLNTADGAHYELCVRKS